MTSYNESELEGVGKYNGRMNYTRHRPRFRPPFPSEFELTLQEINFYGYPLIVILGTIGNILAYLVFTRTRLKKMSSLCYLSAVAITDTGFLFTFFLTKIELHYHQQLLTYIGICQLVMFLNYCFTFLSIWYMVALVVDRFIALYFPLRKCSMCTVFRAKLVVVGIGALAIICYSYITYFYGVDRRFNHLYCVPFSEFEVHYINLDKIDVIFVAVIPYVLIIILVLLILIRGCEYYKLSASSDMSPLSTARRKISCDSSQIPTRITRILCPVIIMTLVFNPPQNVMRMVIRYGDRPRPEINQWVVLCHVFYLLGFAIKGYLYFAFSHSFRIRLKAFLFGCRIKIKHICKIETSLTHEPQIIRLDDEQITRRVETGLIQSTI